MLTHFRNYDEYKRNGSYFYHLSNTNQYKGNWNRGTSKKDFHSKDYDDA